MFKCSIIALLKTIIQWSELRLLQAKWVTYKAKWAKLVSKKEKQNRWEKKQIMSRPTSEYSNIIHSIEAKTRVQVTCKPIRL
jgi:hypothetical protein